MFKESEHPRVKTGSTAGQFTDAGNAIKEAASDKKNIFNSKEVSDIKNISSKIEKGEMTLRDMRLLEKTNPKLAHALDWVSSNMGFNTAKFPDEYHKEVFNTMTEKRNYNVFRVDNRFSIGDNSIKAGFVVDLSDRIYHTSAEKATANTYNRGKAYILNIVSPKTLKVYTPPSNSAGDNELNMISGKFNVIKIDGDNLFIE